MFPKTQDDTIDRLLRAQGSAAGKELPLCREFDADLANAYVERSLKESEQASYENHLAACSPCRKTIVALTRMAQADQVRAHGVAVVGQARGASPIRQWLGALTVPQWAMAAAALVVLAVTLPLILSHRATPNNPTAGATESGPPSGDLTARAMTPANAPGEAATTNNSHEAKAQGSTGTSEKPATDDKKEAQSQSTSVADGVSGGAPALAQTPEPKPADQTTAKTEAPAQPSAAPASETAQPQASEVAKDQTKEKQETKDATATASRAKRADSDVAGNIAPPPPPPSRVAEAGRDHRDEPSASVSGMQPFRSTSEAAAATPSVSRRIGNHLFLLRGDVWTDKDFNPDKDKPVTIIRDSDVYHSLLARDAKIEPFLKGFSHDARVIFKFKGTAYKLIPQDADR
ncbi:MAG: hypothetical protein ACJ74J_21560 [Blastocatellia bacterium]